MPESPSLPPSGGAELRELVRVGHQAENHGHPWNFAQVHRFEPVLRSLLGRGNPHAPDHPVLVDLSNPSGPALLRQDLSVHGNLPDLDPLDLGNPCRRHHRGHRVRLFLFRRRVSHRGNPHVNPVLFAQEGRSIQL